ncbi:hypothetical protein [Pseudazoarcus pumilus]|uniref:Uncharacterized protein n=1 Tax=Pseudazoarcus pumilus TaxID=2067960 RepID=A0A2I6S835_9RHOO|nr:hypothetical protein [Pseudazoarcus pumilus]AUN95397.1 hypothetical protein C0099_10945 [Pseudazoarcus pumilus]
MSNALIALRRIFAPPPLMVGTVTAVNGAECVIELDDGGIHTARGDATVNDRVWFRPGGVIEGAAPAPTVTVIEI